MLGPELRSLDKQLQRFKQGTLRLSVFGRVGVGKSSLLNALLGEAKFATDVAHGCTREQKTAPWPQQIPGLGSLLLVDTPGIDEIAGPARQRLATKVANGSDLILFVLDAHLTSPELEALQLLRRSGKQGNRFAHGSELGDQGGCCISQLFAFGSSCVRRRNRAAGLLRPRWAASSNCLVVSRPVLRVP